MKKTKIGNLILILKYIFIMFLKIIKNKKMQKNYLNVYKFMDIYGNE